MTSSTTPPPDKALGEVSKKFPTVTIESEMRESYLDYAMSVIVSRALPDVRDGLKPVHRRILYSMHDNNYSSDKQHRKSARIVGDVVARFHPHDDTSIYDAMVRLAQDFSLRLPLLDGQGNFGSLDSDPPAAMRYTEIRMGKPAERMMEDINLGTVDFRPNYDGREVEPSVLPTRIPNLLANGSGGIAVGMATNIPPYNLGEVIEGCLLLLSKPETTHAELAECVKGPDFPTGGIIIGGEAVRKAMATGIGVIIVRSNYHFEKVGNRQAIIFTDVPFQVSKKKIMEDVASSVRDKVIEGISALRDESGRDGVRIVMELKRDEVPQVIVNRLFRSTPLQSSFGVRMLAVRGVQPAVLSLRDMIRAFLEFREQVITRRTRYLLQQSRDRAHILIGLLITNLNIDRIIKIIRNAANPAEAKQVLISIGWEIDEILPLVKLIADPLQRLEGSILYLSDIQAQAILDMRINRLTSLGRAEVTEEVNKLNERIHKYLKILSRRSEIVKILRKELLEVQQNLATPRRTKIQEEALVLNEEKFIKKEDVLLLITHRGYAKRVPMSTYLTQHRGGKGKATMPTRDHDFVTKVFCVGSHDEILLFSSASRVYKIKAYLIPEGSLSGKGKPLQNMIKLQEGEKIRSIIALPENEEERDANFLVFSSTQGKIRCNRLRDFVYVPASGKIAMQLEEGDRIVEVKICGREDEAMLFAKSGKCVRFPVTDLRVFRGRSSSGVKGIALKEEDSVVSFSTISRENIIRAEQTGPTSRGGKLYVFTVTSNGYGKKTNISNYRVTKRGNQGVTNIVTSDRNGDVIYSEVVRGNEHVAMITKSGNIIRISLKQIRTIGRRTQGVRLFRLNEDDKVVSVDLLDEDESVLNPASKAKT